MTYMKHLPKCHYSMKHPLFRKIPGCAPKSRCSLNLVKKLYICSFIKNALYQGRSSCNLANFSKFLENLFTDMGYRAFKLYAFIATAQKMKFSIKDFFTFTEKILNRKLHFLCSVCSSLDAFDYKFLELWKCKKLTEINCR